MSAPQRDPDRPWWTDAVIYQIYLRSFADSDSDGVGDLDGVTSRMDYLSELGVDALWITPFYPSPGVDHGYDVADPRDVDPLFGDLDAFDRMLAAAHERNIRVTVDVVPNHVSSAHPWFAAALESAPGGPGRARFWFRDGTGPDGTEPPNNWVSMFGGPAWTRVPDGQWYLHLFDAGQPDLNWTNAEVRADFERTLRFWLDRDVDGFRIDVAHGLAKPEGLPDMVEPRNADVLDRSAPRDIRFDDDAVHAYWRAARTLIDSYPGDRMAVGEAWVTGEDRRARYARSDELHLVFGFGLTQARWDAEDLRSHIDETLDALTEVGAPATWVLSNHDVARHVSRYGNVARGRAAALLQLALPGAVYLYQGDELGLSDVDLPEDALCDPTWERSGHTEHGRDGARVPIPWSGAEPPYGFAPAGTSTWLPMPIGWGSRSVQAQRDDPDSVLSLYRQALELRHTHPAFEAGRHMGARVEWLPARVGVLEFVVEPGHRPSTADVRLTCVLTTSHASAPLPPGEVLLSSAPLVDDTVGPDTAVWVASPSHSLRVH